MNRSIFFPFLFLLAILFSLLQSGCTSSSRKVEVVEKPVLMIDGQPAIKFSENPLATGITQRKYQRMTKQKLEEESDVQANAGSLWNMEGQGAYLFVQNKTRKEGDLLNVRIEGQAQKQIETKVAVIKKLLKQLEEEEAKRKAALEKEKGEEKKVDGEKPAGQLAEANAEAQRVPAADVAPQPEKEEPFDLQMVPTKIVERSSDGAYRVKGSQPFMIGKREYKVIVTGMIRTEDFNDEGVNSSKLYDSQFDVVSLRRKIE